MKLLSLIAIALVASTSNAKTFCVVNRENQETPNQYDQLVAQGELDKSLSYVVKADGTLATVEDLAALLTFENGVSEEALTAVKENVEKSLEGARIILIFAQENDGVTIAYSRFDKTSPDQWLSSEFIWSGSITNRPALAIHSRAGLLVTCSKIPALQ